MKIQRRDFLWSGIGLTAAARVFGAGPSEGRTVFAPNMAGKLESWMLSGSKNWSQDNTGVIYSPIWNECMVGKGHDLLRREDFAFIPDGVSADIDVDFEFRDFYWGVVNAGIVLRSQDDLRYYLVEISDHREGKNAAYTVCLWKQDPAGYRYQIASGTVAHSPMSEETVWHAYKNRDWEKTTPGWMKVHVEADGERFGVSLGGTEVVNARDSSYPSGRLGLFARGPVQFRNLKFTYTADKLATPWKSSSVSYPRYFYLYPDPGKKYGDNQSRPGVFRTVAGDLVAWMMVGGENGYVPDDALLVRSRDEGASWEDLALIKKQPDGASPWIFFGHRDGRISCLYTYRFESGRRKIQSAKTWLAFSTDGGKTWGPPQPLQVSEKPFLEIAPQGHTDVYSPPVRLSDGSLIQFFYQVQSTIGGSIELNSQRRDRSLAIRSTDDGKTWTGPYYLDSANFDSNEAMAAECKDGSLVALSRTLEAPFMWATRSRDAGKTWSRQVQSDLRGGSPYMLRHSSGVLLVGTRVSSGLSIQTSVDEGRTWLPPTRISICPGMMGMVETKDGRVLIVFQEGYNTPCRIRGQYFLVYQDGRIAAG